MRSKTLQRRTFLKLAAATGVTTTLPRFAFAGPSTTLVVAHSSVAPSLDGEKDHVAACQDIYPSVYETLVAFETKPDPKFPDVGREDVSYHADRPGGLALKPKLAEKWEVNADGTKVTFHLRQGVKSQYGNLLTPDDVKWSWTRKLHVGGAGQFFSSLLQFSDPEQIKIEGDNVVSFNLPKPNPLILKLHTNTFTFPFDSKKMQEHVTADDPWATKFLQNNSAGYGAYKIDQWTRGQQMVLSRREDYYGEKPFFEQVIIREVPSSSSRMSLLQGGAIDMAFYLAPREANALKSAPNVSISDLDSSLQLWVHLNNLFEPFNNKKVRQAMNYLIPQDEIVKSVFYGMAEPQRAPYPRIYPMVNSEYYDYSYNVEKAKSILADAGFKDGFKTTITYDANDPVEDAIALIIQTSARQAGIDITLDKLPTGVYWEKMSSRKTPLSLWRDMPVSPDPNYATALYFAKDSFINLAAWSTPETESLIQAGRNEFDDAKRTKIYDRIQQIIMDECPWGFVVYPNYILARKPEIEGYVQYSSNGINFSDLRRKA